MREDEQIRWEKAVEHSLQKGREEVREEGRPRRLAEGGATKQRETAARMKSMGMTVETTREATGFSAEGVSV